MLNKQRGKPRCTNSKTMNNYVPTKLKRVPTEKGESIEEMLRRLMKNNEPVPDEAPEIFTAAEEGIMPEYDIRTDRHDLAYEATDKFEASDIAKADGLPEISKEETTEHIEETNNKE